MICENMVNRQYKFKIHDVRFIDIWKKNYLDVLKCGKYRTYGEYKFKNV